MQNEKKLETCVHIAHALNAASIHWALGGSLLLYFHKITPVFHDIDLLIDENDISKAKNILDTLGQLQPPNPNAQYKTHHFLEYRIEDTDVDVMAEFVIVRDGKDYACPLQSDKITSMQYKGETLYLDSLSNWKRYYALMKRQEKVEMIEKHLQDFTYSSHPSVRL